MYVLLYDEPNIFICVGPVTDTDRAAARLNVCWSRADDGVDAGRGSPPGGSVLGQTQRNMH